MNATITATPAQPTKLRNGSWGARVTGNVTAGQTITIKTKAGKTWDAEVAKVVWSGDNVAIVATRSLDRWSANRSSGRRRITPTGCSCGSVEEYSKRTDCFSCAHDNQP